MSLSVLGVDRMGWIPLDPACTPVPSAMPSMAIGTMNLAYAISPLPAVDLAVSSMSVMLLCPPVLIGIPTSSTALLLLSVDVVLVTYPAVV